MAVDVALHNLLWSLNTPAGAIDSFDVSGMPLLGSEKRALDRWYGEPS